MERKTNFSKLVTTAEAAELLGLNVGTLQNYRWLGRGPRFFHLGKGGSGVVRYRMEDLRAWAERNPVETFDSIRAGAE